ncbi:MAG: TolC family protein [Gemmatimonadales bacterium]|nr:TolC family protein [Gemmatimonadales bacterium]
MRSAALAKLAAALLLLSARPPVRLSAQQPATLSPAAMTLDEALRLAAPASEAIGIARAQLLRAEAQREQARAPWLPQLSGSATYTRTFRSQFDALLQTPGGGNFPLGQRNAWNLNLTAQQTIWNFRLPGQTRAAALGAERAKVELSAQEAQTVLDVTRAYYDALLADRLVAIADSTLRQAERTLADVELGRKVGTQAEFDLLRARVARDNAKPAAIANRRQRELAYLRLRQLLNLPADAAPALSSPLIEDSLAAVARPAADSATADRAPVRQAEQALRQSDALLASAKGERLPSIGVQSSFSRVGFGSTVFPSWDRFLTDWFLAVRVDVPLYTGGRLGGGVRAAEASRREAALRLRQAQEAAQQDATDALLALDASEAQWAATSGTVEQARRAYAIAELRFREGLSSQTELTEARLQLQQADANRAQAARDLRVARVRAALLRDLPLATVAAASGSGR